MTNLLEQIEAQAITDRTAPRFRSGAMVRVHQRIVEGQKERIQVFEGTVIAYKNAGLRSTMTVRKISYGVGVERIFPVHSPAVEKVEWLRTGRTRRARLYFLRDLRGKRARLAEVRDAVDPTATA